jgi:hypothetical protein
MNANERESGESISVYSRAFAVSTKLQPTPSFVVRRLVFGIWVFPKPCF